MVKAYTSLGSENQDDGDEEAFMYCNIYGTKCDDVSKTLKENNKCTGCDKCNWCVVLYKPKQGEGK